MKTMYIAALFALILAGCGGYEKSPFNGKDQTWFQGNTKERDAEIDWCRNKGWKQDDSKSGQYDQACDEAYKALRAAVTEYNPDKKIDNPFDHLPSYAGHKK
jgi:hypothetical protein